MKFIREHWGLVLIVLAGMVGVYFLTMWRYENWKEVHKLPDASFWEYTWSR